MAGESFRPGRIRTRTPRKLATTTYVNEVAEAINNQDSTIVGKDSGDTVARPGLLFLAKVTDAGPAGEADLTGERHWVIPQIIKAGVADAAADMDDWHSLTPKSTVPATNAAARGTAAAGSGAHILSKGDFVYVRAELDKSNPAKVRYVIVAAPFGVFPVTTATNTGSGGTCGAACSFTYDIKKLGQTNTIGTALTPQFAPYREPGVIYAAGSQGLGFFNGSNAVLWEVNETFVSRIIGVTVWRYSCSGTNLVETTARVTVTCGA